MTFVLKQTMPYVWAIFDPKGHQVSDTFRGNKHAAIAWGNAWISSFNAASLKVEDDEKAK